MLRNCKSLRTPCCFFFNFFFCVFEYGILMKHKNTYLDHLSTDADALTDSGVMLNPQPT